MHPVACRRVGNRRYAPRSAGPMTWSPLIIRRSSVARGSVPGADLAAVEAVTADILGGNDPLDLVGDLVDANLLTVAEAADGEPRIAMLETIRAFALAELAASGDLDLGRDRHARHYLDLAERFGPLAPTYWTDHRGPRQAEAGTRLEAEHDNLGEALRWTLQPENELEPSAEQVETGLRLCGALFGFWQGSNHLPEPTCGRRSPACPAAPAAAARATRRRLRSPHPRIWLAGAPRSRSRGCRRRRFRARTRALPVTQARRAARPEAGTPCRSLCRDMVAVRCHLRTRSTDQPTSGHAKGTLSDTGPVMA